MAVTVVSGYAVLRARVASQDQRLDQLEARMETSNTDQGRRVGELEGWRKACEAVERDRRRARTGAVAIPPRDEPTE
jgi:type VI protein secretion system component VasK